jgi:hypothetical protein
MRIIGFKDGRAIEEDPGGVTMANMPIGVDPQGRNTSGTFSTPTPSDVRYGDVTTTEFEDNVGHMIPRDAAALRDELGQPQVPGGIVVPPDLDVINEPGPGRPDNKPPKPDKPDHPIIEELRKRRLP